MELQISKNIPPPVGRQWAHGHHATLRRALVLIGIGHSFLWADNKSPYRIARELGIGIKTRKEGPQGWRVWKISERKNKEAA